MKTDIETTPGFVFTIEDLDRLGEIELHLGHLSEILNHGNLVITLLDRSDP